MDQVQCLVYCWQIIIVLYLLSIHADPESITVPYQAIIVKYVFLYVSFYLAVAVGPGIVGILGQSAGS